MICRCSSNNYSYLLCSMLVIMLIQQQSILSNNNNNNNVFVSAFLSPKSTPTKGGGGGRIIQMQQQEEEEEQHQPRRHFLEQIMRTTGLVSSAIIVTTTLPYPNVALAADGDDGLFTRRDEAKNKFGYQIKIPDEMEEGSKPLKTHLDETNFKSTKLKKYAIGITIDPVRIKSLKEFGAPAEVAAKVVNAEVNRDGVFEVKLMKDAIEYTINDGSTALYQLNYLSQGKRGNKRFVTNFCVANEKLYAVTIQVLEDNYIEYEKEILSTLDSFRIL